MKMNGISKPPQPKVSRRGASVLAKELEEMRQLRTRDRERLEAQVAERTRELETKNAELIEQAETVSDLSGRLLQAQDDERRRIARDLHDVTGQEIDSIAITLDYLARHFGQPGLDAEIILENAAVAHKISNDIRTLSYLLHPPLLDELGLGPAVHWYGEGFEKRSGIRVAMKGVDEFPRLAANTEIVLFRVLQEALTNVHRYSAARLSALTCPRIRIGPA